MLSHSASSILRNARLLLLSAACWAHAGCEHPTEPAAGTAGTPPLALTEVEDNIAHDTLLVHITFDLGDGSYLMVASNRDDTFEGLRLYRYRPLPDSSAEVLAVSSPAYDSWTMLPACFAKDSARSGGLWILANFGERESWGLKLMRLDSGFHDLGFLDAALPERVQEEDARVLKRRNIAPHARMEFAGDSIWIRFACDSVYLYDDQGGHYDEVIAARRLRFLHAPGEGLSLWLDGEKRPVKLPG